MIHQAQCAQIRKIQKEKIENFQNNSLKRKETLQQIFERKKLQQQKLRQDIEGKKKLEQQQNLRLKKGQVNFCKEMLHNEESKLDQQVQKEVKRDQLNSLKNRFQNEESKEEKKNMDVRNPATDDHDHICVCQICGIWCPSNYLLMHQNVCTGKKSQEEIYIISPKLATPNLFIDLSNIGGDSSQQGDSPTIHRNIEILEERHHTNYTIVNNMNFNITINYNDPELTASPSLRRRPPSYFIKNFAMDDVYKLPTIVYKKTKNTEISEKCIICQEEFVDFDHIKFLTCFHKYHQYCIDKWLELEMFFPLCKEPLCLKDPTDF